MPFIYFLCMLKVGIAFSGDDMDNLHQEVEGCVLLILFGLIWAEMGTQQLAKQLQISQVSEHSRKLVE